MDPLLEGSVDDYGSTGGRRNEEVNGISYEDRDKDDDTGEMNPNDGSLIGEKEELGSSTRNDENEDDDDGKRELNVQKILNENTESTVKLMDKSFTKKLLRTALADAAYLGVVSTFFGILMKNKAMFPAVLSTLENTSCLLFLFDSVKHKWPYYQNEIDHLDLRTTVSMFSMSVS